MTHHCTACQKTPEQTKFALMDGSNHWRSMCNLCRNARDRERAAQKKIKPVRDYGDSWLNLCADCRPDWSFSNKHIPKPTRSHYEI